MGRKNRNSPAFVADPARPVTVTMVPLAQQTRQAQKIAAHNAALLAKQTRRDRELTLKAADAAKKAQEKQAKQLARQLRIDSKQSDAKQLPQTTGTMPLPPVAPGTVLRPDPLMNDWTYTGGLPSNPNTGGLPPSSSFQNLNAELDSYLNGLDSMSPDEQQSFIAHAGGIISNSTNLSPDEKQSLLDKLTGSADSSKSGTLILVGLVALGLFLMSRSRR